MSIVSAMVSVSLLGLAGIGIDGHSRGGSERRVGNGNWCC